MNIYRIIDANLNRAAEGLRVIEEIARFVYEEISKAKDLKELRHKIRETAKELNGLCLEQRDTINDCGFHISQNETKSYIKEEKNELAARNFKRVQEALRVIEENLKTQGYHAIAKEYEQYRFLTYNIEKRFFIMKKQKVLDSNIYCITGEEFSLGRSNIEVVNEMIKADVKIIQYREKEKNMLAKYKEAVKIRELTNQAGVCFIINDDIALAMAVKADGIHIGQEDMPINEVRKLAGENIIIGVSTHSPDQAQKAAKDGADYIGVGPIFKTYTKKDVVDPVGYEYLEYITKNIQIPFVVIGGIKEHNIAEAAKRGAKCFAMITEIVGASNIYEKIQNIRKAIRACAD